MIGRRGRRPGAEYLCPFCFSRIDLVDAHYACGNPLCAKRFLEHCGKEKAKRYRSLYHEGEEIDVENSVFLGRDPAGRDAVTTKSHIIRRSEDGLCDVCRRAAFIRLCPVCHNPIPHSAEEGSDTIFTVLGPRGAGKSHYVAVLIDQLRNPFSAEFGSTLTPASDRTTVKYRNEYYKRLFEEGRTLPSATPYDDERAARDPLIYYLRLDKGKPPRSCTLAFFDTAGEDLDSVERVDALNIGSFVAAASGIIYLVDPLQIPYVNARINVEDKPDASPDVGDRLGYIADILRSRKGLRPGDRIDVPLAVVLTKADVLMKGPEDDEEEEVLLGPESSVRVMRRRGTYDERNFDEVGAEVEEYLRRTVSEGFIQAVDRFSKHEYFAVSALGSSPSGEAIPRGIAPFRVEDPLIWLLNTCGGGEESE